MTILSVIGVLYQTKKGTQIDKVFVNRIFRGKSKIQKLAFSAAVADVALAFKRFIESDLIDGKPDMLMELKMFLLSHTPKKS